MEQTTLSKDDEQSERGQSQECQRVTRGAQDICQEISKEAEEPLKKTEGTRNRSYV